MDEALAGTESRTCNRQCGAIQGATFMIEAICSREVGDFP
jgi:hypothetical protein